MLNKVRILVVGDIVGKGARNAFLSYIPTLKEKYNYDILAINGENTSHGSGLTYKHYLSYVNAGVDVITMGNHVFGKKEIAEYIDKTNNLVIPGNLIEIDEVYNLHKQCVVEFNGQKIKFTNIIGSYGMNLSHSDPLAYANSVVDDESITIIDYHAELTAEKNVLAYFVDGKASLVYGTHTHVQTADERILPQGTAFISDVGMCGSRDSVIGYDFQSSIAKYLNNGKSFVSTRNPLMINAILVEIDLNSKKALSIIRINENMN